MSPLVQRPTNDSMVMTRLCGAVFLLSVAVTVDEDDDGGGDGSDGGDGGGNADVLLRVVVSSSIQDSVLLLRACVVSHLGPHPGLEGIT